MSVQLVEARFNAQGNSNYDPCVVGLHLCGSSAGPTSEVEQPYSALNIPARTHEEAQAMFAAAKAEAACEEDEADFICDLNLGSARAGVECVDDFWTNRQLVDRLYTAAVLAARPSTGGAMDGEGGR